MRSAPVNIAFNPTAGFRRSRRFNGWLVLTALIALGLATTDAGATANKVGTSWVVAQNTGETTGNTTRTPRVISKPQTVVEDSATATQQSQAANGTGQADSSFDLLAMLPESWRQKLEQLTGGTADGSNDELVKKIALPAILVVALLFLLPFFLASLIKHLFRRRTADPAMTAARYDDDLADLDLEDIDLSATASSHDATNTPSLNDEKPDLQMNEATAQRSREVAKPDVPEHANNPNKSEQDVTDQSADASLPESPATQQYPASPAKLEVNHDLADNPAFLDATVELSHQDVTLTNDQTSSVQAVTDAEITPDTAVTKGQETMTGMQSRHPEDLQGKLKPPVSAAGLTGGLSPEKSQPSGPTTALPMTKFGVWLNDLPAVEGAQYSTEALLYWISYGAGNASPQLREELNNATELNDRGRIKRAVLSAKPEIFHDILLSVQVRFSPAQQLQLLDLMLAVLVSGDGIKPVENLMLRFFCDYTGIGLNTLESRYLEGFNSELPGIPRPDRLKWWEQTATDHSATTTKRLFGLRSDASDSEFQQAYKLAEHRHDPSRFGLLGEKQQSLALRNLQKYKAVIESRMEQEA